MFNKCPKGIFTKINVSVGYFDVCSSMGVYDYLLE